MTVEHSPPTGVQLRMARAGLGLSLVQLSRLSGVALNNLRRAEDQVGPVTMREANLERLLTALRGQGVSFLDADAHGAGVRIRGQD